MTFSMREIANTSRAAVRYVAGVPGDLRISAIRILFRKRIPNLHFIKTNVHRVVFKTKVFRILESSTCSWKWKSFESCRILFRPFYQMLGVQVRLGSEVRGSVRQLHSTHYRL